MSARHATGHVDLRLVRVCIGHVFVVQPRGIERDTQERFVPVPFA
jgi:hypothetical protein